MKVKQDFIYTITVACIRQFFDFNPCPEINRYFCKKGQNSNFAVVENFVINFKFEFLSGHLLII